MTPASPPPALTDRPALERHRARAGRNAVAFLHEDAIDEIKERLSEVNRSFTAPAVVVPHPGPWADLWARALPGAQIAPDTATLALAPGGHDLVIHALCLHWADDPLGQIIQCRRALQPDGLFMAVLPGGRSLQELRAVLAQAESDLYGSLSPRVLPMADIRDAGALLQRAGLAMPVADSSTRRIHYRDLNRLVADLRGMGETNALAGRRRAMMPRALWQRAALLYRQTHATSDGYLIATSETLFLTGWAPADSQPKPLRPGSATARLADALGTDETPLGPVVPSSAPGRSD
ncbi:MAG: SAM-dependent methyltransferase [Pararhodobacter sp.]